MPIGLEFWFGVAIIDLWGKFSQMIGHCIETIAEAARAAGGQVGPNGPMTERSAALKVALGESFPIRDLRVAHYPDPTDAAGLVRTVAAYKTTLLVTTPTFLSYMFGVAKPRDLASLRIIVTGTGVDDIVGGNGRDTVDYADRSGAVTVWGKGSKERRVPITEPAAVRLSSVDTAWAIPKSVTLT